MIKLIVKIIIFFSLLINYAWCLELNLPVNLSKGIQEYKQQNFEEALYYLLLSRQEIKNDFKNPLSGIINYYLGLTFKQTSDLDKAIYCFEQSLQSQTPALDSYLELIELHYNLGHYDNALKLVQEAEGKKLFPAKISFLKGQIYLKMNKNKQAIQSFEQSKKTDKSLTNISNLQIAIANINDMKYSKSIEQFNAIINNKYAEEEIKQMAIDYRNAYKKIIDEYKSFKVGLGTGLIFDSNVTAKPTVDIQYLPASNSKDTAITGFLNLSYVPLFEKEKLLLGGQYTINGTFYKKLKDFNSINQNLIINLNYSNDDYILSFPIFYGYNTLGDKGYMSNIGINPNISYMLNNKQSINLGINLNKRSMFQDVYDLDEDRNAMLYGLGLGYTFMFGETNNNFLNLKYEYIIDKSRGINWVNNNQKLGIYYMGNLKQKLNLTTGVEISPQNYKNINTIFDIKRKDIAYNFNIGGLYKILENFYFNVQYIYVRVGSNIAIYDYKKNMLILGIEYKF